MLNNMHVITHDLLVQIKSTQKFYVKCKRQNDLIANEIKSKSQAKIHAFGLALTVCWMTGGSNRDIALITTTLVIITPVIKLSV